MIECKLASPYTGRVLRLYGARLTICNYSFLSFKIKMITTNISLTSMTRVVLEDVIDYFSLQLSSLLRQVGRSELMVYLL